MPKKVDHEQRRAAIAAAVARIAMDRGLQGVSFREVAAEVGMSVSLVQHYVGTKENLLVSTLDIESARMGARIVERVAALGDDATPLERLRAIAVAFLPTDDASREAMLVYQAFSAGALTDPSLRSAAAFRNADVLLEVLGGLVAEVGATGGLRDDLEPRREAQAILALVLGLSLGILLEQTSVAEAEAVIDTHLERLARIRFA